MSERLKEVQKKLEERGVVDVKLVFSPDAHLRTKEELKEQAANAIEAYLNGEFTTHENFNDEILPDDLEERVRKGKMKQIMQAAKKEFPDWLGEV